MHGIQLALPLPLAQPPAPHRSPALPRASGEKTKARDLLAASRVLKWLERDQRPATDTERQALSRFPGFGPVALSIFPDPVSGRFKDVGWQVLGEELQALLTPEEYASAKRTTFNAFYTSPTVIAAMHEAIARLGVPASGTALEPLCAAAHNAEGFIRSADAVRGQRPCNTGALWIKLVERNRGPALWGLHRAELTGEVIYGANADVDGTVTGIGKGHRSLISS
jgi:hypothetical protein